jgi:beta-xylosidase
MVIGMVVLAIPVVAQYDTADIKSDLSEIRKTVREISESLIEKVTYNTTNLAQIRDDIKELKTDVATLKIQMQRLETTGEIGKSISDKWFLVGLAIISAIFGLVGAAIKSKYDRYKPPNRNQPFESPRQRRN